MTQQSRQHPAQSALQREAYPAARAISPRLQDYFARQLANTGGHGERVATLPDAESIASIIDAAFWASLRREEGFLPRISLAFVAPEDTAHPLTFERPLRIEPGSLTRIAPAVERAGIHLGVWRDAANGLYVWGAARGLPKMCFVAEVAAAGLIVIKNHSGETSGKFVNVAVLEGDQIKIVDQQAAGRGPHSSLLASLLGLLPPTTLVPAPKILRQLAVSMRLHGRGGSLLIVSSTSESWRDSIVPPMPYALSPPFADLANLSRTDPVKARLTIDAIAGLTAVDGAVVVTDRYEVLGFGAKIVRARGRSPVEQVRMTEPVEGAAAAVVHPEELGGTRHLSAAQFVQDQRDAVALVASQDQRFTIFEWSLVDEIVCAHRVDALLL